MLESVEFICGCFLFWLCIEVEFAIDHIPRKYKEHFKAFDCLEYYEDVSCMIVYSAIVQY